jgi:hypothetical protein
MGGGMFEAGIKRGERGFGNFETIDESIGDCGEMLAESTGLLEYLVAYVFLVGCRPIEAAELAGLGFGQQFGLGKEPQQILVGLKQLFGRLGGCCIFCIIRLIESIVERVDEVECGITVEFEQL